MERQIGDKREETYITCIQMGDRQRQRNRDEATEGRKIEGERQ